MRCYIIFDFNSQTLRGGAYGDHSQSNNKIAFSTLVMSLNAHGWPLNLFHVRTWAVWSVIWDSESWLACLLGNRYSINICWVWWFLVECWMQRVGTYWNILVLFPVMSQTSLADGITRKPRWLKMKREVLNWGHSIHSPHSWWCDAGWVSLRISNLLPQQ